MTMGMGMTEIPASSASDGDMPLLLSVVTAIFMRNKPPARYNVVIIVTYVFSQTITNILKYSEIIRNLPFPILPFSAIIYHRPNGNDAKFCFCRFLNFFGKESGSDRRLPAARPLLGRAAKKQTGNRATGKNGGFFLSSNPCPCLFPGSEIFRPPFPQKKNLLQFHRK